ncbi:MAG: hypothetical protein KDC66_18820 [Phaeodactylibacter sp.]|nr:hypothetical protein [Phaeodactylibacter sp.]MCB9275051.1 hypothetical protein [Lewinellaceae bacterium]
MKTLLLSTLLVCLGANAISSTLPTENCAFVVSETLTLADQLVYTLPDGMWRGDARNGIETVIQFEPSGKAFWFAYGKEGLSGLNRYQWVVYGPSTETAMLELRDENGRTAYTFEVEAQCQSISLDNLRTGALLKLNHDQGCPEANLEGMERMLNGKWENNTYPFEIKGIEGAYLKYRFFENGKLERLCGSADKNIHAGGQWQLANDGRHVVMSFEDGSTVVAEIKHLDMDELVLSHVLACEDQRFATREKDFFFNRN